jgi:ATP-dependent DNA helicase RecG
LSGDFFCNEEKYYRIEIPYIPTLSEGDTVNETINETIKSVLIHIKENPKITQRELCDILGKSRATITRAVKELQESGMLIRVDSRKNGHWEVTES